jgi:hypothetical protein
MTSSLFNEALDDAKAIKAAAEERAKQQLLETMSPKLKKIVENTINQQMGLSEGDDEAFSDEYADDELDKLSLNDSDSFDENESDMYQESDDIGESDCDSGMYQETDFSNKGKNSKQQNEAKEVLNILLNKDVMKRNLKNEVNNFEKDVKSLKRMFSLLENHKVNVETVQKVDKTLLKLVENSKNIASNDIIKNQIEIKKQFSISLQELNQMTKRRNNILAENYSSLSRRSRRLFEAEDEQEDDDMGGMGDMEGMEGMGGDDDMGDMEGMEGMGGDEDMGDMGGDKLSTADAETLQAIARRIEDMVGGGGDEDMGDMEDMEDMEDMGDEEDEDEDEDEDESASKNEWSRRRGRLFAEADEEELEEGDEEEFEVDEQMTESDFFYESDKKDKKDKKSSKFLKGKKEKELEKESQRRRGDVFLEIDENMLKREIARMKRLREGDAEDMASHFGGGKIDREMFVDSDDGDLNGNVGNLGSFPSKGRLKEGRSYNSNSSTRLLEGKVQSYERALTGMKGQLSEMTLFNAKLLYANKLMQNKDLTTSQQRHIVESLDQAKTLREAKLLFEGLSKSLLKGTGRSGSLNESANRRITGGSSRSTSSAQSSQNRIETDRWALLAGIKK